VLKEPESPLGSERDTEDLEPSCEKVKRAGTVQMKEIDIGNESPLDEFREDEHEAFLHRGSDRSIQGRQCYSYPCSDHSEGSP
jgi:hypothetical protein